MANEPTNKLEQGIITPHIESGQELKTENKQEQKKEQLPAEVITEKPLAPSQPIIKKQLTVKAPELIDDYHLRRELEVDNILSEGLSETFLTMPPDKQKLFKIEGEKTVKKINVLLDSAKINVGKIISLIRKWLSIIPGVNRFFLDQEAKIKSDNILKIKNKL